jgi:hypothetical protein
MKQLISSFCLLWLLVISGSAFAQTGEVNNGYWLNGGRIMELRNGTLEPLNEQVVLPNGLTLLPNGDLVTREGVRRNLQQGQAIDATGRILFPQNQRDGSVILVPRSAYIIDRDPGLVRHRNAGRPSVQAREDFRRPGNPNDPAPGMYRRSGPPASPPPGMYRRSGPPAGKAPGQYRGRIR